MTETIALLILVAALGLFVWALARENQHLRSQVESRLNSIETLGEPLASKLAVAGPVPLKRAIHLHIHLDETFWRDTIQLSPAELEKLRTSVHLHSDLSKTGTEDFWKASYYDITVRIQQWHGGYTHIDVRGPLQNHNSIELYPGNSSSLLWRLLLPPVAGEELAFPTVKMETNGYSIRLLAAGSRFGYEHTREDSLLEVPLEEGATLGMFFKPDYKTEVSPGVLKDAIPWVRCYQNIDLKKGLAWQLWIDDCELFARSGGSSWRAKQYLLADCRRIAADRATGQDDRAFYQRFAGELEARLEEFRSHLREFSETLDGREVRDTEKA